MKIIDYEYVGPNWEFSPIRFQKINLIVGDSGTGKTRLFNTIFNLGTFVAQGKPGGEGNWNITLEVSGETYRWSVLKVKKDNEVIVEREQLYLNGRLILDRDNDNFQFEEHKSLPKLAKSEMSIYIFKEEELIEPLHKGFSKMLRRRFFDDSLTNNSSIIVMSRKKLDRIGNTQDLYELYKSDFALNPRLYVLNKYYPSIFNKIVTYYLETFEYITEVAILESSDFDSLDVPGGAPIFCIKERYVDGWLRLDQLSSGMQKVLLILTDLLSLPEGSIYLLDEYENSLGIGAINILPNLLISEDLRLQIIFSSHHPYIISHIPVENWYIAHRRGSKVQFAYGDELVSRYNISSQEKYIQLLNDPFYSEGIE